jgi:hypothetical protein
VAGAEIDDELTGVDARRSDERGGVSWAEVVPAEGPGR